MFVERIGPDAGADVESVLVPTAGGPHAELAGEVAGAIARSEDATCSVAHVVEPDADEAERRDARDALDETASAVGDVPVETELLEGEDVVSRLLEAAEDHEMTIVGATRESRLRRIVFGAVPESVGRQAQNVTIMARRRTGLTSRLTGRIRELVPGGTSAD